MKLFSRLKARFFEMVFSNVSPWSWLLPRTKFNYEREVGDGQGSSTIMAPVLWIARTFPEAPVSVEREGELEHDHDMLSLIRKPNLFYSGHTLSMATMISFVTDGNAYWLKLRNRQLKVIQLWYVPHWMMQPKSPADGTQYITHYEYSPGGKKIILDVDDVVHFRYGLDPRDIRKGLAPLYSVLREVFTDDEAANFTASLLHNAGVPGLVVSPASVAEAATDKDLKATKAYFKKAFGGDKRGEPLVMRAKTDVKQFGFSPQELDLSKLRQIPEERVTAILGIPAAVVGFGTGLEQTKVGATMSELREMAYESCIIPIQRLIAAELDSQLLSEFETDPKVHTTFDLSSVRVLQEDQNEKAKRLDVMVRGGWLTVAEAQRQIGMEADDSQEIYLRGFNLIPVPRGEIGPTVQPTAEGEKGNGESKRIESIKFFVPVEIKDDALAEKLWQQLYKDWMHLTGVWSKELEKTFSKLGDQAADIWNQLVEDRDIQLNAAKPHTKDVEIDEIYALLIVEQIDPAILAFDPHFLRVAKQTIETITAITGLVVNLTDPAEMRIIANAGTRRGLVDLTAQIKDSVFKALTEARSLGEGPPQAAARIRDMVSAGPWSSSEVRSQVIARTETKFAQNVSSLEAYGSGGIDRVQIVDGQLSNSCEPCIERNGQIMTISEAYALEEHPNGTLSFAPVVGGS